MPSKKTGYSSYIREARYKTTQRIVMPQIPNRPLRFQLRSVIRHNELRTPADWSLIIHRRGLFREKVGVNPLEARAMPHTIVKGYLTERILFAALVNLFHFVPGIDFDFQSSLDGGRMEMGGLVADFIFRFLRIVINPLGPQHYQYRNTKKDEEQVQILAEMGYQCYLVDEEVMYDEFKLEEFLRRIFGGWGSGGGDAGGHPSGVSTQTEQQSNQYDDLMFQVRQLEMLVNG